MTLGQLMSLVGVANKGEGGAAPKAQAQPGTVTDLAMLASMRVG